MGTLKWVTIHKVVLAGELRQLTRVKAGSLHWELEEWSRRKGGTWTLRRWDRADGCADHIEDGLEHGPDGEMIEAPAADRKIARKLADVKP